MRVDEWRRNEVASSLYDAASFRLNRGLDRSDGLAANTDVGNAPIRQRATLDDQVKAHLSPFW